MKREGKKLLRTAVFIFCVLYFLLFSIHIIALDKGALGYTPRLQDNAPVKMTDGWKYRYGDSPVDAGGNFAWLDDETGWTAYQFPGRPDNPDNRKSIWIKASLPEGKWLNPTLRFRAPQQAVEIYLHGKRIYSFGRIDFKNTDKTPGSILHLAPLPSDFRDGEIYFRLYSPFCNYTGYLIEIEVGDRSEHILNILEQNGLSLIFGCIFIFAGIVMILFLLSGSRDRKAVFSLGLSTVCLGLWNIAESKTLQLFIDAPVASVYVANISIILMPIGFAVFVEHMYTREGSRERLFIRRLRQGFIVLALTALTADMTGLASILSFNGALHVLLAISIIVAIYVIIKNALAGNSEAYIFAAGLTIFSITGLYDAYIMFYDNAQRINPYRVSYWGMLAFIASLIIIIMIRFMNAYETLMTDSRDNEANYKALFNNMTDGFAFCRDITDNSGRIVDCRILEINQAFTDQMGISREAVIGRKMLEMFPEISYRDITGDAAAGETAAAGEDHMLGSNVPMRNKWYRISPFTPREGYRSIIFTDITEMKIAEETITHQAYTDSMTGCYNRTYFEDFMSRMGRELHELKPLSFVAIDIDGLKITNDTFGHKMGDDLLKEAAKIISQVFNYIGLIARVGGDEFCVILPNMDAAAVDKKREELVHLIDAANKAGVSVPISMSIGAATSEESDNEDIYNIYRRADDDMYQYKLSQSGSEKSKVIDMLLTALSEKDYVSQGHVERLAGMAEMMADTLGLSDVEKRNLVLLSKMHDLGKIGIPDEILNKPERLTTGEFEKMKQHVRIGYNIASRSKELVHIAPLILHHHERWDGKGYPDGLRAGEIPLECRVLGIIDAYDAMTNDRPYHTGIQKKEALAEIARCSGTQFDPAISKSFVKVVEKYLL